MGERDKADEVKYAWIWGRTRTRIPELGMN